MTPRKQTALQALVGICAGVGWTAGFAWLIARDTAASSTGDQPLIPWGLMAWCGAMGLFVGAVVDPGFRKMQYAPPETPPTLRERAITGIPMFVIMALLALPVTWLARAIF
ncbi:MAG TPA: hypothetical protein QGH10_06270 [Armatimonadota bacterium]|nr:hypothetical protein [Armatimonadota bacterium]